MNQGANTRWANRNKGRLELIQILIGIIVSAIAAWSAWLLNKADVSLKTSESLLKGTQRELMERDSYRKDAELARAERESNEKKQLMVYETVVKAIESKDEHKQAVSQALVASMLSLEDPLRHGLLAVLASSSAPRVRADARAMLSKEVTYQNENNEKRTAKSSQATSWLGNWDFDIFWCERSGEAAKKLATTIADALNAEGGNGRIRSRLLPDSINARPGYQNTGLTIRYNTNEKSMADKLKQFSDRITAPHGTFELALSAQPTPWYLSAFVCPTDIRPN